MPPPRSPRGRGAGGRFASLRSTCPHALALGHSKGVKGLSRHILGLRPAVFHGSLDPLSVQNQVEAGSRFNGGDPPKVGGQPFILDAAETTHAHGWVWG
ncbi:hypothetical protein AZ56_23860 [Salmonella enterica subsp. enterica serovar Typhimurium]|nr:hypothetical protein [Salmonella enterica subsp. enterica serovar Typhimurium]EEB2817395.1 hypothetical protein [Salmonella enterica subsp. enterica serovar Typhimurium]EED4359921.1 hypothetical protein [Salmonella enterica subsp. enterica serovar Typhimurium]